MRVLAILLALAILPAFPAQGKGKGKAKHGHDSAKAAAVARFLPSDAPIILGYYRGGSGLPPGLAKRGGDLPPGLEKQLRRNGKLPPGLQKKIQPFPAELEVRLAPVPVGYRRVVVDKWALLVHDATNVVFDILDLTRGR